LSSAVAHRWFHTEPDESAGQQNCGLKDEEAAR
jgi:hypothetical protein